MHPQADNQAARPINVLVFTLHTDAVADVRLLGPLARLEKDGLISFRTLFLESKTTVSLSIIDDFDVVVFQREDRPEMLEALRYAQARGQRTIYEIDDNLLELPPEHPIYRYFRQAKIRQTILEFLRMVDVVTVSTEGLKEALGDYNPSITVLANQLDETLFQMKEPLPPGNDPIRIGYAGGMTHGADFQQVVPALKRIQKEYRNKVKLVFFWHLPEEFEDDPTVEYLKGHKNYQDYARVLTEANLAIGLAPLQSNRFNDCKSDIKYLEYASQGIAGVYSKIAPYSNSVKDGETGLLVDGADPDQWYSKVKFLIDHPDELQRVRVQAQDYVRRERTLGVLARGWYELFSRVLSEPSRTPAPITRPLVSIIIPVKDRLELTRQCLREVRSTVRDISHEIIIVDNGSTDELSEFLKALEGDISYLYNKEGATFAESNNQGAVVARGEYLVFLNNDTIPQEGWLHALLEAHQRVPDAGTVGARLLYPESHTIQHAGVLIRNYPHPVYPYHAYHEFPAYAPAVNEARSFPALTAACLLIKKSFFHSLKGFDEDFINGYEDVDLCLRVLEKGRKNIYTPGSVVYHYKSQTPGRFDHVNENIAALQRRWSGKIESLLSQSGHRLDHYDVSIVMLTFNALEYTKRCVDSLRAHTNYPHEVIFVDNESTDGSKIYLRGVVSANSNYRLIENNTNVGFSTGNNQGAKAARGQYLLLLNNDVLVADGWLDGLVSALERDERIGMVGPITNYISGRQRLAEVPYQDDEGYYRFAKTVRTANRGRITPRRRIAGFAILIRKALYDELGGLDENFGSGNYEDDDLCLRVREKGYAVMVDESTFIHHFGSRTFAANQIDYQASLRKNEQIFRAKWPDVDPDWLLEKGELLIQVLERKANEAIQLINRGDFESGGKLCREVLLEDPTRVEAVYGLGLIAHLGGDLREARNHYQRAVSLKRGWAPVLQGLALIDMTEGDLKTAQLRLAQILENNPRNLDARRLLGQTFLETEQFEEGIGLLMGILKDDPNDWQTHFILSSLYAEVDRMDEAKRHLEAVLAAKPDHAQAREMLEKISRDA
ncbi:MAG: glycosyltransferase [Candidatus Neomarinimicrobiota bacterium]